MMNNLFSVFDPSSSIMMSINWISSYISIMIFPSSYWLIPSRINLLFNKIMFLLYSELKILMNLLIKGSTMMFISMFMMIMFNNTMGLFPYIFTCTSHMVMTLMLSIPIWFTFMIFGWLINTNYMFIHLVPQGTPPLLMSLMVCIEMISNLIRPGTLAIRLTANMIAGHLLLTLMGNTSNSLLTYQMIFILMIIQTALFFLEITVAFIQSYVFTVLSTLYSSEVI